MDRGYLDFERLHRWHRAGAFFVTRGKSNLKAKRRYSHPVDRSTGLICDQTIVLTVHQSKVSYPDTLRRVRFKTDEGKTLVFLTNNFTLPALTITELYRCRWQVELFFKWIKQHLRLKTFFGTSENAVKSQVWIAVSVYVLVAIVRKRLRLETSLYETLQILSLTMFETTPLDQLLTLSAPDVLEPQNANQLNLFES
jgi:IS4 transposase